MLDILVDYNDHHNVPFSDENMQQKPVKSWQKQNSKNIA